MNKKLSLKQWREIWESKGLCLDCGSNLRIDNKIRCGDCVDKHRASNKRYYKKNKSLLRSRRLNYKDKVYNNYGGPVCNCCGEVNSKFLSIDHINNDGNVHRRRMGKNKDIYRWLIDNNYPTGFQVLCYNCNFGKNVNGGICPHLEGD